MTWWLPIAAGAPLLLLLFVAGLPAFVCFLILNLIGLLALIQNTAKHVAAETAASSARQRRRRVGSAQRSTSIVIAMWARRRVCSGIARKMTAHSM